MTDNLAATDLAWDVCNLLAGHHPDVQGDALAWLLATWLKSFLSKEPTRAATRKIREKALQAHLDAVWKIVDAATKDEWPE